MSWVTVGVSAGSALLGGAQAKKEKKRQREREGAQSQLEADRQRRIDMTRGAIDRTFEGPGRQQQYADYATAMREQLGSELVRQKRDAARNLKFSLAKAGQTGGSQAVDANYRLGEEFQRGALQNERNVQGGVASLRGADEQARNNLLALADSGLDLTSALRRSGQMQASNLGNANINALQQGMGDVFAETGKTYKAINERVAQRRGFGYRTNRNELYG
jgi:hypothetical protein